MLLSVTDPHSFSIPDHIWEQNIEKTQNTLKYKKSTSSDLQATKYWQTVKAERSTLG